MSTDGAPPKKPGVSSVFANARATAKDRPWKVADGPASAVVSCKKCGAPQQPGHGFVCAYCGTHLSGEEEPKP